MWMGGKLLIYKNTHKDYGTKENDFIIDFP